jgi:hypothetical protein
LNTLTVWFLGGLGAEVQHSAYWMYLELFYFYGYWFIGTDWIGLQHLDYISYLARQSTYSNLVCGFILHDAFNLLFSPLGFPILVVRHGGYEKGFNS